MDKLPDEPDDVPDLAALIPHAAPATLDSLVKRRRTLEEDRPATDAVFAQENIGNFLLGIIFSSIFADLLLQCAWTAGKVGLGGWGTLEIAAGVIFFVMGLTVAYAWRSRRYATHAIYGGAALNTVAVIALSHTFLGDFANYLSLFFLPIFILNLYGCTLGTSRFRGT